MTCYGNRLVCTACKSLGFYQGRRWCTLAAMLMPDMMTILTLLSSHSYPQVDIVPRDEMLVKQEGEGMSLGPAGSGGQQAGGGASGSRSAAPPPMGET